MHPDPPPVLWWHPVDAERARLRSAHGPADGPHVLQRLPGRQDLPFSPSSAPLVYQIHTLSAWAIVVLWPFSRLVHAWSIPLQYIGRPYILYRRRYQTAR